MARKKKELNPIVQETLSAIEARVEPVELVINPDDVKDKLDEVSDAVAEAVAVVTEPKVEVVESKPEGLEEVKVYKPISWSTSKADTANECMYKYKRVYVDKVPATGRALWLGSTIHDIQADELISRNTDLKTLVKRLDAKGHVDPEIYAMTEAMCNFTKKWVSYVEEHKLEYSVEKKYAITREFKATEFLAKDVFIRGVIDLWAYDEKAKRLIVVDHKTSKSALNVEGVKNHKQLNLYVWMLTKLYGLEWDRAQFALNFTRHDKLVWSGVSREEMEDFGVAYCKFLNDLEDRVNECLDTGVWPREPGFYCNWCSFKGECKGCIPQKE